jgi:septal ring factor EnvC (AmiA/AmiB activator)
MSNCDCGLKTCSWCGTQYKTRTYIEFIDALYEAGWTAPNDAQHIHIAALYEKFVGDLSRTQQQIADLTGQRDRQYNETCEQIKQVAVRDHEIAELTKERERISNDLEREVEAHGRTTRRLNVYLQAVVMAPIKLYAVHEADPVPMPTTQSLATLLDKLAQARAALAEDQVRPLVNKFYGVLRIATPESAFSVFLADLRRAAGFEEGV